MNPRKLTLRLRPGSIRSLSPPLRTPDMAAGQIQLFIVVGLCLVRRGKCGAEFRTWPSTERRHGLWWLAPSWTQILKLSKGWNALFHFWFSKRAEIIAQALKMCILRGQAGVNIGFVFLYYLHCTQLSKNFLRMHFHSINCPWSWLWLCPNLSVFW